MYFVAWISIDIVVSLKCTIFTSNKIYARFGSNRQTYDYFEHCAYMREHKTQDLVWIEKYMIISSIVQTRENIRHENKALSKHNVVVSCVC